MPSLPPLPPTLRAARDQLSPEPSPFQSWIPISASSALKTAMVLALLFTAVRAFAMLGPPIYRGLFLLHCIPMALVPWLLTRDMRRQVGLQRSTRPREYVLAAAAGLLIAGFAYVLGAALFGKSPDHWFVSVADSFRVQPTPSMSLFAVFLMFTIPAVIFSPIGEEIFFRGYLQRMLETRFSARTSTIIEASWFPGAHLIHHGIVLTAAGLSFRALSGTLWFLLMFGLSCMLAWLRKRHDSVYAAIVGHAAFNLGMNACIFAFLWTRA